MAYYLVTGSTDLTTKGRAIASWHFRATAAAVVNIRNASVTGDIVIPINLALDTSDGQSYSVPGGCPIFPNGVYVQVVSGTVVGSVDILT